MTQFTELEQKVLESLIDNLYAEPGFSDVDATDLSEWTGIPTKQVRGVLSSLIKKGVVTLDETDTYGAQKYVIVYLALVFALMLTVIFAHDLLLQFLFLV